VFLEITVLRLGLIHAVHFKHDHGMSKTIVQCRP